MAKHYILIDDSEFQKILDKIAQLDEKLDEKFLNIYKPQQSTTWLTREEVAIRFKTSIRTIDSWTKLGILTGYDIATSVRYKEDELDIVPKPKRR